MDSPDDHDRGIGNNEHQRDDIRADQREMDGGRDCDDELNDNVGQEFML